MPTPRSTQCARCGYPKSDEAAFSRRGKFADGSVRLSSLCKSCHAQDEASPKRLEQKRNSRTRKRRQQGIPERQRGAAEFCPNGHRKADNLRPGRYDCAACHRDSEIRRARENGVKPRGVRGEGWSCGHDPETAMRYAKGKPKGCLECHREKQRLAPYNPERWRNYVSRNREAVNAYRRSWRAANRPDVVEFRKGGVESVAYARLISGDPCVYCGVKSQAVDHIVPVTLGGMGEWTNLAPICTSCNSSKNNSNVLQFLMRRMERSGASR